ncbi:hypothetical protein [Nocardiopsis baichengensis]|uniref:hypothetical protein n=1 Tax=Nocardiopsis baichengensis TaxID=280240 RepID=UPI0003497BBC|nr:hypothetical protein [Nocardiopsis baichengensis]
MGETAVVRVRTARGVAELVQRTWRAERDRLASMLEELPDPGEPGIAPSQVRERRRARRRYAAQLRASGTVRPTANELVADVLSTELAGRGWLAGQLVSPDPEQLPVSRWPGTGTGRLGAGYPGTVYARVSAELVRRTVAGCWSVSAEPIRALLEWRDAHPRLTSRRADREAWAEYDRLAAKVLTPGDVYRAALERLPGADG